MRAIPIALAAEHDEGADSDSTVRYVSFQGMQIAMTLIGIDVPRLETALAELLSEWELQSQQRH
jgi:hypothetical protein